MQTLRNNRKLDAFLAAQPAEIVNFMRQRWPLWARAAQQADTTGWTTWLILGGRGAGKTRTGAEWVKSLSLGDPVLGTAPLERIALVGETYGDGREVMIEGESGLLSICNAAERPLWQPSRRRLQWCNGSVTQLYSSEDPEALRGPQFAAAWCDELAKWNNARATWDNLQFALRLGQNPRQLVTTTPRRVPLLKDILEAETTLVTAMRTGDNRANLAAGFFDRIIARYEGTALGRQELDGLLVDEREGALWSRQQLEAMRAPPPDDLVRIVVAIDPPVTGHAKSDACGIIVAGLDAQGRGFVLQDATMKAVSPERWSGRAVELYHRYDGDCIVVETNQGGDMAESVLRAADPSCPVRQVKATRSKYLRAEPVAHLYERGDVRHCGDLGLLEDEMCDFTLDGLSAGRSPDRLDALVWALTDLMLNTHARPRARSL